MPVRLFRRRVGPLVILLALCLLVLSHGLSGGRKRLQKSDAAAHNEKLLLPELAEFSVRNEAAAEVRREAASGPSSASAGLPRLQLPAGGRHSSDGSAALSEAGKGLGGRGGYGAKHSQQSQSQLLAVLVPYRNRLEQLSVFLRHIRGHLAASGVPFCIVIAEQLGSRPFNRGALLNAAFLESQARGAAYVAVHDVDLLPLPGVGYGWPGSDPGVRHLASQTQQWSGGLPHPGHCSGALLVAAPLFRAANGYSNGYWGWGGEDDDFCLRLGRQVEERRAAAGQPQRRFAMPRPRAGGGRFASAGDHAVSADRLEFRRLNLARLKLWQMASGSGPCTEGLSDLEAADVMASATTEDVGADVAHLFLELPPEIAPGLVAVPARLRPAPPEAAAAPAAGALQQAFAHQEAALAAETAAQWDPPPEYDPRTDPDLLRPDPSEVRRDRSRHRGLPDPTVSAQAIAAAQAALKHSAKLDAPGQAAGPAAEASGGPDIVRQAGSDAAGTEGVGADGSAAAGEPAAIQVATNAPDPAAGPRDAAIADSGQGSTGGAPDVSGASSSAGSAAQLLGPADEGRASGQGVRIDTDSSGDGAGRVDETDSAAAAAGRRNSYGVWLDADDVAGLGSSGKATGNRDRSGGGGLEFYSAGADGDGAASAVHVGHLSAGARAFWERQRLGV